MALPLRVEPECPLSDEGTEWIVGRSTESMGLMYSADSWTHGLAPEIFTAGILFLC